MPDACGHGALKQSLLLLLLRGWSRCIVCASSVPLLLLLQFERFCRPYYTAGFNAYELVEAAMVSRRAETVGA